MPPERHHISQQVLIARVILPFLLAILLGADFLFWIFSRDAINPFPAMPGLVVGGALATTFMIVAIFFRNGMARTALVVFNWLIVAAFSVPALIVLNDRLIPDKSPVFPLMAGIGGYIFVNILLITVGPLHRIGVTRGCGH